MNFDEYERHGHLAYSAFAEAVAAIVQAAIAEDGAYRLQQIQRRGKSVGSLRGKLIKFEALERDDVEAVVKDLAGCRVIFYTNADVRRFLSSDILRDNFEIDWDRTKVHHPVPGTESEGRFFISDNIVVRLKEPRASAPEYARFRGLQCEIQIQTTLNHAWSEMEHDVYKIKPVDGFGKELLAEISKRFEKVMRTMLIPAGYEFQKIVDDYNRLASGRELFDKAPLRLIAEATNSNDRYELLERFKEYVLPNLDDPSNSHAEILETLVAAAKSAQGDEVVPISTPWGNLPGKTLEELLGLICDVLDHLRYISLDAIERTFDALSKLFQVATSESEKARILKSVEALASHNYEIWKVGGPVVQDILVRRLRSWDPSTLDSLRPVALAVLEQLLEVESTGTSSTYKAMTITTANVAPSEHLSRIRGDAIHLLEQLFKVSRNDAERRVVKGAMLEATRLPNRSGPDPGLEKTVLEDSTRVVRFFLETQGELSFELLQTLEDSFLWLYRHTRRSAGAAPEDVELARARQDLRGAILEFRDRINSRRDFVVYKTLVGYESVFPHAWEGDPMDIEADQAYRRRRFGELVDEVDTTNADDWLNVLRRCASTDSSDLATFPSLGEFLEQLSREKPAIVESYLDRLGVDLETFIPGMLQGLEGTDRWPAIKARVDEWVRERRHLSQVLWHQRFTEKFDWDLVRRAMSAAAEARNDGAMLNAVQICAARSGLIPRQELGEAFSNIVRYFSDQGSTVWANAIGASLGKSGLVELLTPEQVDLALKALKSRLAIDHYAEFVLSAIAKTYPEKVIDFFGERLSMSTKNEGGLDRFEPVPFRFSSLAKLLASRGQYLIEQCRAWHCKDRGLFEFRGGRLFSIVFETLSPELEGCLRDVLEEGADDAPRFVADLLRGFKGSPDTHELYKLVVDALPDGDPGLSSVEIALMSTGVVHGEFGMREALQRKRTEIDPWLADPRPRVSSFARSYARMLDRRIAAEQRRSEADIEAMKREFGAAPDSEDA
jgi:ppGpp synthetase/RelA/SpoT-type nucleotidyltranferase